jgi:hypothetical protein
MVAQMEPAQSSLIYAKSAQKAASRSMRRALRSVMALGAMALACKAVGGAGPSNKAFELEILSTEKCPLPTEPGSPERAALGVKVKLTSRVPDGVAANYFYASVLASDGSRYLAELPGCSPVLSGAPLYSGEARLGYVNIPIPSHKQPEKLVYSPPVGKYPTAERVREVPFARDEEPEDE